MLGLDDIDEDFLCFVVASLADKDLCLVCSSGEGAKVIFTEVSFSDGKAQRASSVPLQPPHLEHSLFERGCRWLVEGMAVPCPVCSGAVRGLLPSA
jgi:hypothetical protein